MNSNSLISWKEAFFASPGPTTSKEAVFLWLKGLCMGSADIIPGVSGGTIALITGIYEALIQAIRSFDITIVRMLLRRNLKEALSKLHFRFLLCLFFGIGTAIVSLARVLNFLLHYYPQQVWSLFFGLILASIVIVGSKVEKWTTSTGIFFSVGTVSAYLIVGLIPVSTPETLWFIFLSGILAICAMILPGLSGAFILLILGKYEFITATLKNPFAFQNMLIILIFGLGCFVGLTGFSRILSFFLKSYHGLTLALLTGLMTGSMRKIWPWKEGVQPEVVGHGNTTMGYRNIIPIEFDSAVWLSIVLIGIGLVMVFTLERLSRGKK